MSPSECFVIRIVWDHVSLVIVWRQRNFCNGFGGNLVFSRPKRVEARQLRFVFEKASLVILNRQDGFDNRLFDALTFFRFRSLVHFGRVTFRPQSDKLGNDLSSFLVFEKTDDLFVFSGRNAARMSFGRVARVEHFLDVRRDVLVKVHGLDLVAQRVGVRKKQSRLVAVLRFDVTVVKVVHQDLRHVEGRLTEVHRFVVSRAVWSDKQDRLRACNP